MPAAAQPLCDRSYALRLLGPAGEANTLAGELEHVLRGIVWRSNPVPASADHRHAAEG